RPTGRDAGRVSLASARRRRRVLLCSRGPVHHRSRGTLGHTRPATGLRGTAGGLASHSRARAQRDSHGRDGEHCAHRGRSAPRRWTPQLTPPSRLIDADRANRRAREVSMKRVLVIGSGGTGKTTVARRLAQRTGLPLIHLDLLYWRPGWQPTPGDEWQQTVGRLVAGEEATGFGWTPRCASQGQPRSLFNGKDLTGWHVDVPAADSNPRLRSPFLVRNGVLVSLGEPRGHLITDSSYRDYRLDVEYR